MRFPCRWNLIAEWEQLPSLNSQPSTLNLLRTHHWGPDLSGTAQGAGGVGGLVLTRHHRVSNGSGGYEVRSYIPAYDGNGNIVALLDLYTAEHAADYEYGPFGEPLRATGPMAKANPFRFSTKYCDEETGLCYYGYRYYQSANGRWLRRDPIGIEGGLNLYGFGHNSPVGTFDNLGLFVVSDDFVKTYPKAADAINHIKNYITPKKRREMRNWCGCKDPFLVRQTIDTAIQPGQGPTVDKHKMDDILTRGADGCYDHEKGVIFLKESLLQDYESGKMKNGSEWLQSILEHELIHHLETICKSYRQPPHGFNPVRSNYTWHPASEYEKAVYGREIVPMY